MRDLLAPDYTRDSLRKHGGLLLGLGVLMIFLRKGEDWSDFVIFILLAAMAVYLYASVFTTDATDGARPWQAVHSVFGLIFVPLALAQFVDMIGDEGDSGNALNVLWIFGLTAALGFYAGAVKGIRFHLLLASIATIIAWSALWQELLGDEGIAGHFGTYRGLLGIISIILLGVGLYLWRRNDEAHVRDTGVEAAGDQGLWKASELLTGAGIAAVLACSLGISSIVQTLGPLGFFEFTFVETAAHWDVLLLLVSLGLVGLGSTIGTRGPVYVGAIGLLLFLFIVGFDLDEGEEADPTNLGLWPIVLVVLGGLAVLLSTVKDASLGDQPRRFLDQLRGR
jgi:NADH:ubiquinone oxidoreductase subunit 6 (subunit J)